MALGKKALKKAKKLESEGLKKIKVTLACLSDLDELLNGVYDIRRPKPVEYDNRRALVGTFNAITKEIYGNSDDFPIVEEYGSFVMDMFSAGSDLDLSVNFSNNTVEFPREKKIETLRKFAKKFKTLRRRGHFSGIQTILTARVPIVKVIDSRTGIECDLSIENRDGIVKSWIIYIISTIDERFQKLSILMKAWAKAHDINSSRDRTLNSLSIISLVAFHLQTRDPPILPPFSALFKDGADPANVMKMVQDYLNNGKRLTNKESLAKLFVTLLLKLASDEKRWRKGLCASLYEGSWISKNWDTGIASISIEDFSDRSQNFARAVGKEGAKRIYSCVHHSIDHLGAFFDGQIQGPKFKELFFGADSSVISTLLNTVGSNLDKDKDEHSIHHGYHQAKKRRLTEGCGGEQLEQGRGGTQLAQGRGGTQLAQGRGNRQLARGRGGTQLGRGRGGTQVGQVWGGTQLWQGYLGHASSSLIPQVPYQTSFSSSLNKAIFPGPSRLPSVRSPNPIGSEGSYGTRQQPSPALLQSLLGLIPPAPSHGPIYGQHAQNHPCPGPARLPSVPTLNPIGSEGSFDTIHQPSLALLQSLPGLSRSFPSHGPIYGQHAQNHPCPGPSRLPSFPNQNPIGSEGPYGILHQPSLASLQSLPGLIPPVPSHGPIYGQHAQNHPQPRR